MDGVTFAANGPRGDQICSFLTKKIRVTKALGTLCFLFSCCELLTLQDVAFSVRKVTSCHLCFCLYPNLYYLYADAQGMSPSLAPVFSPSVTFWDHLESLFQEAKNTQRVSVIILPHASIEQLGHEEKRWFSVWVTNLMATRPVRIDCSFHPSRLPPVLTEVALLHSFLLRVMLCTVANLSFLNVSYVIAHTVACE